MVNYIEKTLSECPPLKPLIKKYIGWLNFYECEGVGAMACVAGWVIPTATIRAACTMYFPAYGEKHFKKYKESLRVWEHLIFWEHLIYSDNLSTVDTSIKTGDPRNIIDYFVRTYQAFVAGYVVQTMYPHITDKGDQGDLFKVYYTVQVLRLGYSKDVAICYLWQEQLYYKHKLVYNDTGGGGHARIKKLEGYSAKERKRYIKEAYAFIAGMDAASDQHTTRGGHGG